MPLNFNGTQKKRDYEKKVQVLIADMALTEGPEAEAIAKKLNEEILPLVEKYLESQPEYQEV